MTAWYLARGAGLSALVLLTVTTTLGALVSGRGGRRLAARRYLVQYLHRACAGLGLAALVLHVGGILADSYASVGWVGALVPFASGYRPGWVALGTVAVYLSVVVAVLGLARGRLAATDTGARVWRRLHLLGYAAWLAALWHGFGSGTDSTTGWVRVVHLLCLGAVVGAAGVRLARPERRDEQHRLRPPVLSRPLEGAAR